MKLGSLIDKECILVGDSFPDAESATRHLIELFHRKKKLPISVEKTLEIVREREKLGGIVLPSGMAIPHGRIDEFHDLLIGIWIPPSPFALDGREARALFFFLTSKTGTALYLPTLAALSKWSQDSEAFEKFLSARNQAEASELLNGIVLKNEITVEDIMTPDPVTCVRTTTLAELADLFYGEGLSFVPVVDENGDQIGEVTIKDLISRGIPDYVRRLANTRFLKTLEPFEALLLEEDKILVEDIMRKPSRNITPDSSIIEAATKMTAKGFRHLPVVDGKKLVGIVSEMDILKKVIRG
jgi:CBS domain-containing protein/mannitol/fructose-specific phosphotransferase system IIA component (Ntr-type)